MSFRKLFIRVKTSILFLIFIVLKILIIFIKKVLAVAQSPFMEDLMRSVMRQIILWCYQSLRWCVINWRISIPGLIGAFFGLRIANLFSQATGLLGPIFTLLGIPMGMLYPICAVLGAWAGIYVSISYRIGPPSDGTRQ